MHQNTHALKGGRGVAFKQLTKAIGDELGAIQALRVETCQTCGESAPGGAPEAARRTVRDALTRLSTSTEAELRASSFGLRPRINLSQVEALTFPLFSPLYPRRAQRMRDSRYRFCISDRTYLPQYCIHPRRMGFSSKAIASTSVCERSLSRSCRFFIRIGFVAALLAAGGWRLAAGRWRERTEVFFLLMISCPAVER